MEKFDFKAYKEAKIVLPHIEGIIKVIDLSERSLKHFKSYLPVIKILRVMEEQKQLLSKHRDECLNVIKNKAEF